MVCSTSEMENQKETGSKEMVTKEEIEDHHCTGANAFDPRKRSENPERCIDSVKGKMFPAEEENMGCQESATPLKQEPSEPTSSCTSSSSKVGNKAKRLDTIVSNLFKLKNNGSTVRIEPVETEPKSSTDHVANEHSIREFGSEDHEDECSPGDADMKETGLPNQQCVEDRTNDVKGDSDEGQFTCLDCAAVFDTDAAFKKHIVSHEGYRRFKCTMCELRFNTKQYLKVHMHRHTGEKLFTCDVCEKKFITNGELTRHKRIHTGNLSTMVIPAMPLSTSRISPTEQSRETKFEETGRAQPSKFYEFMSGAPVDMSQPLVTRTVPLVTSSTINSTSPLKATNRILFKRHAPIEPSVVGLKGNGSTVRNAPARTTTTSSGDTGTNKCFIWESGSGDHAFFKLHIVSHPVYRRFKCPTCEERFATNALLIVHLRNHIEEKCHVCGKKFTTIKDLIAHKCIHTGKKRSFECPICQKKCTHKGSSLQQHIRIHTGEKPFKCDVCGKCFTQSGQLTVHNRIHTGEKPFKCDICDKGFAHGGDLQRHKYVHSGNAYKCLTCGECFSQIGQLQKHKRTHAGSDADAQLDVLQDGMDQSSIIEACDPPLDNSVSGERISHQSESIDYVVGKIASGNTGMNKDTVTNEHSIGNYGSEDHGDGCSGYDVAMNEAGSSTRHKVEANNANDHCDGVSCPFTCLDCAAAFETDSAFKEHIASHEGYRRHKCTVCEKRFTTKQHFAVHMRTHTGELPFKCDICDKKCLTNSELTVHKRIHTGEKPFKCDVCEKCFTQSGQLTVHKRIHTGERPFECDVCKKKFTASGTLVNHKLIHTGNKPFKCEICNKGYVHGVDLQIHKRAHSGEKPYICETCGECFSHNWNLKTHKRRQHADTDAGTQPDVSHLQHLLSSSLQADASTETSLMEDSTIIQKI